MNALVKVFMSHPFFKNHGPLLISEILKYLNIKIDNINFNHEIIDIKDLNAANTSDISFFHSKKYKDIAKDTKASFCITTEPLKNHLPKNCIPLIVQNVF